MHTTNPTDSFLLNALTGLAMDLHWSWNHATDKIWHQLDANLWHLTHNPLVVLQTVSARRLSEVLADPIVQDIIKELTEAKLQRSIAPAWFQHQHAEANLSNVAYFSMEYMLSEALPIYSGGLGNVAGDLLKSASDLGVPVTGIGLLYQQGYSRQIINRDGSQQYVSPFNDPGQLPISPLRSPEGEWLRIQVNLPGYSVWLRTWQVEVGRTRLLLLDSNDAANFPQHRDITNKLYTGDPQMQLLQELILGFGGWRLLKQLGIRPEICHLNEGHSAFVVLERALDAMQENNIPFEEALLLTRSGNLFTTHTAVGAGFDRFSPALLNQYLADYVQQELKISFTDFLALGRQHTADASEPFNTSFLAIRGSGKINAVSGVHRDVSRRLFAPLFPGWPVEELPIDSVTNGVHMATWDSPAADRLWTEACGKERWLGTMQHLEENIAHVSDERLWSLRMDRIHDLLDHLREHYVRQIAIVGSDDADQEKAKKLFDPKILTVGFARRFVPYKRPNLLLYDRERLKRILLNPQRPVQLVLAGKAHPQDVYSQGLIQEWVRFIADNGLGERVVFLSDYDMLLTEQLVQGVDLWLNTPRRPWEACGTSGMKVLVNGGLNLSELDGWWDEAYSPEVGWTFGDRQEVIDDNRHDREDAERLYKVLEDEIIPLFYQRNDSGIPAGWVEKMRASMARLTWRFSSNRSLMAYTENYYLPMVNEYRLRAAQNGKKMKELISWINEFRNAWQHVSFGHVEVEQSNGQYHFAVSVSLNGLKEAQIAVELFANSDNGLPVLRGMEKLPAGKDGGPLIYIADVPADRPASHYTPRIVVANPKLPSPLESNFILWEH